MLMLENLLNGILLGGTYSLVAISFTLIFGVLNRMNIAHGATVMVAAFAGASVSLLLDGANSYLVLVLAMAASVLVGALTALLVFALAFAPLRNASPLAPFVTSAALAIVLQEVFQQLSRHIPIFTPEITPFPSVLENLVFPIGGMFIRGVYVVTFAIAVAIMLALHWWVSHTYAGRSIRAVEENPVVARLLGINVRKVEMIVFLVAGAIAGAAGCLIGMASGAVQPFMGSQLLLVSFVVIILAGLGSVYGAMVCGLAVGALEMMIVGVFSASVKEAVLFAILFAVLVLRPQGLFAGPSTARD